MKIIESLISIRQEVNDPYKNDETSNIDQKTLDALWELGAFGLKAPIGKYHSDKAHFCEYYG